MIPQGLHWTGFQREHLKSSCNLFKGRSADRFHPVPSTSFYIFIILPGNADLRSRSGSGKEEYGSLEKSVFLSTIYVKPNLPVCICKINFVG